MFLIFFLVTLHKEMSTTSMNSHFALPHTLNLRGKLTPLEVPLVMGILNVTEESFYEASQMHTADAIRTRAQEIINEGGSIIDIGACSTKPGISPVSKEEELKRLEWALPIIREVAPEAILSIDTFRSSVAALCIERYGVQIINDVSGGEADAYMFDTVAQLQVPYILTYDGAPEKLMYNLADRINRLHLLGVNDIIVDPGFGFGKTLDENYRLMAHLEGLNLLECPLLVGVSRKSMIYKHLGCTPEEALNGTTALHTIALIKGAHILRVHDVKTAVEAVQITQKLKNS